ncbi:UbiH/UbiF family hydroxylase [Chelatococcus sp. SYSU_G07232]|uniref:UbiH/UbiF family hydroxylase n=1 Tax=Chelatococcus albus TaxID=3047466 RepID=A0ABT7ABX7_9HYPH|nr:UbiH/UbiF family hydroxylase [Chelatococcus sp. SYSU_G07232]MDJ1156869.1 UbiH/UbiF family hydroxylase [Chelatococcus sp. SYSU_G07232]
MATHMADIAVVGAGPAGLAAAIAFAREGFRTLLVGAPDARRDGRTVALLDGSVRFLSAIGAWEAIAPQAAPLVTMRIIDDTGSLFRLPPVAFQAREIDLGAFGYNIENVALVAGLAAVAAGCEDLTVVPALAEGMRIEGAHALLTLADGATVRAHLVLAADGRRSRLREAAGIATRDWSYPQVALTAVLTHSRDHAEASTEFHTRSGPFTLVPLPGRRSSLVWVANPAVAERLAALDDTAFARAVERQAHSLLGSMAVDGPRGAVPMSGLSVSRFTAPHLAIAGEAAHVFPPIGAQGLNLGLRDVAALRDAVADARDAGEDIGGVAALAAYERSRGLDVRMRTAAIDTLNRTLLSDFLPLDLLRGAGLLALDLIGPLRRTVMRESLVPRLSTPRLMRAPVMDTAGVAF